MNALLVRLAAPLLAATLSCAVAPSFAQTEDLPGRVGRVADLAGRVHLSTAEDADDWIEALRNATVTTGDNLWVSGDGRAEIDYGGGQFRLAGDTNVHIARLDDRALALFVAHGRVVVRVRVLDAGDVVQVDTSNTQLTLNRPGLYRIDVSEDRDRTALVVRQGEATIVLAGGAQQVLPGQSASVSGSDPNYADVQNGYGVDGFDTWSAERDRRYERSRSASYVSRQMIGYADLDDHGRWETSAEYGAIWYPTTVVAGWSPYRHGRWSWVGSFGWTWLDDAPWGYAPFHYGRWVHVGNRWGWCPGGYIARPAWAPALVGWYGGAGWSASVSLGAPVYGWVPLGWGEPYHPGWRHCSDRCWTRYNRPYVVNYAERRHAPPTRYVNRSAPGGVTAVAQSTFTGRVPVHANLVAVQPQGWGSAPILPHAPAIARPHPRSLPHAQPVVAAPTPASRIYRERPVGAFPSAAPAARAAPPAEMPRRIQPAPPTPRSTPGNWAAPSAPNQEGRPVQRQVAVPPVQNPNRAEQRPPPSANVPLVRTAPPGAMQAPHAVYVPPTQTVRPAAPQGQQLQRQPVRPAPAPMHAPAQAVQRVPPQAMHPAPPQVVRAAPSGDKPVPRGRDPERPGKPER